ncbi:EAL domain-containing protein [Lyngbya confervoides]|uniref:EAL domain-containing protein n=1 Tax=Lyngbya confervoides BDU141951 TaxID=1574623 RepID=A0ABD4SYE6_9CYAN|nr:EAL domain-containing protein [Lyngbya confervoides]MCM1981393.1 EAL domain-containing protein [Lyngbya confervoides BDU141951]
MTELHGIPPEKRVRHLLLIQYRAQTRYEVLEGASYFVGRDPKSSIVIDDKSVSRQHAILLRITGADPNQYSFVLIDGNLQGKRSKNGTQVNGQSCVSARLQSGDLIFWGPEVRAKYLMLANITDAEFRHYCDRLDSEQHFFTEGHTLQSAKETIMLSGESDAKGMEDVSIIRLASFPEIIPSPMLEITTKGQLTYLNPAAHQAFPDLSVAGLEHPALAGLMNKIAMTQKKILSREVQIGAKIFEQSIHYIPENSLIRCCLFDITQRKQAEAELRRRDRLSQSVAEVTTHLLTSLNQDSVVDVALEMFGQDIGVDRICISQNHSWGDQEQAATSLRYEWVKPGVDPVLDQPHRQNQVYCQSYLRRWYALLAEDGILSALRTSLPEHERNILFRDGILSILVVPINVHNSFWGFLELDHCTQEYQWAASDVASVRALAASIGAALQRQHQDQRIQHQAFHDALTGLPNRLLFHKRLEAAIAEAQLCHHQVGVMFLDLDKFKVINDTLGHSVGDGLLQEVARRLRQCVRASDTVARWGGDEFTILMPNMQTSEDAVATARRILSTFREVCQIESHTLLINTSIGIALYPNDALEAEVLVRNADIALYQSKDRGRGTYQLYGQGIDAEVPEIFDLHRRLKQGISEQEFILHYQPEYHLKSGKISGMEALILWNHPTYGLMGSDRFLPLAEEAGIMLELGEWMARQVCLQGQQWNQMGFGGLRLALRLSPTQFRQPHFADRIGQILAEYREAHQPFVIEISEALAFDNLAYSQEILLKFKAVGAQVVLDDLGAGDAALTHLTQLPLDGVRLSSQLVRVVQRDRKATAVIRGIMALAQHLGLDVTATGVEKSADFNILAAFDCDYFQGNLIGPGVSVEMATLRLHSRPNLDEDLVSSALTP